MHADCCYLWDPSWFLLASCKCKLAHCPNRWLGVVVTPIPFVLLVGHNSYECGFTRWFPLGIVFCFLVTLGGHCMLRGRYTESVLDWECCQSGKSDISLLTYIGRYPFLVIICPNLEFTCSSPELCTLVGDDDDEINTWLLVNLHIHEYTMLDDDHWSGNPPTVTNQGIGSQQTNTWPPCHKGTKHRMRPFGLPTGLGPDGPQEIHAVTL